MLSAMPVGLRFEYPKFDSGWKTTLLTSVFFLLTSLFFTSWDYADSFFVDVQYRCCRMFDGLVSSDPPICCFICYNPTVLLE
jgi:hypothetical protein